MAHGDKTKEVAFQMWIAEKRLLQIQQHIKQTSTTTPSSVRGWVLDWGKAKQQTWNPKISG